MIGNKSQVSISHSRDWSATERSRTIDRHGIAGKHCIDDHASNGQGRQSACKRKCMQELPIPAVTQYRTPYNGAVRSNIKLTMLARST